MKQLVCRRDKPEHVHGRDAGEPHDGQGIDEHEPTVDTHDHERRKSGSAEHGSPSDEHGRPDGGAGERHGHRDQAGGDDQR